MERTKKYRNVFFRGDAIQKALDKISLQFPAEKTTLARLDVERGDERFRHDTVEEFLADYGRGTNEAALQIERGGNWLALVVYNNSTYEPYTTISLTSSARDKVDSIFNIFDSYAPGAVLP